MATGRESEIRFLADNGVRIRVGPVKEGLHAFSGRAVTLKEGSWIERALSEDTVQTQRAMQWVRDLYVQLGEDIAREPSAVRDLRAALALDRRELELQHRLSKLQAATAEKKGYARADEMGALAREARGISRELLRMRQRGADRVLHEGTAQASGKAESLRESVCAAMEASSGGARPLDGLTGQEITAFIRRMDVAHDEEVAADWPMSSGSGRTSSGSPTCERRHVRLRVARTQSTCAIGAGVGSAMTFFLRRQVWARRNDKVTPRLAVLWALLAVPLLAFGRPRPSSSTVQRTSAVAVGSAGIRQYLIGHHEMVAHNDSGEDLHPAVYGRLSVTQSQAAQGTLDSLGEFFSKPIAEPTVDLETARHWIEQGKQLMARLPQVDAQGAVHLPQVGDAGEMRRGWARADEQVVDALHATHGYRGGLDVVRPLPSRVSNKELERLRALARQQGLLLKSMRASLWDEILVEAVRRGWQGPRLRAGVDENLAVDARLWGDDPIGQVEARQAGLPELFATALSREELLELEAARWAVRVVEPGRTFANSRVSYSDTERLIRIDSSAIPEDGFAAYPDQDVPLRAQQAEATRLVRQVRDVFQRAVREPKESVTGLRLFDLKAGRDEDVVELRSVLAQALGEAELRYLADNGVRVRFGEVTHDGYRLDGRTLVVGRAAWRSKDVRKDRSWEQAARDWAQRLVGQVGDSIAREPLAVRELRAVVGLKRQQAELGKELSKLRAQVQVGRGLLSDNELQAKRRRIAVIDRELSRMRVPEVMPEETVPLAPTRRKRREKFAELQRSAREAMSLPGAGQRPLQSLPDRELASFLTRPEVVQDAEVAGWLSAEFHRRRWWGRPSARGRPYRQALATKLAFPFNSGPGSDLPGRSVLRQAMVRGIPQSELRSWVDAGVTFRIVSRGDKSLDGYALRRETGRLTVEVDADWMNAVTHAGAEVQEASLMSLFHVVSGRLR